MRVFVFILVLVNLLFFVWTQGYLDTGWEPDALRLQHQLSPEKMKIVARDEPPTASPAASTPNAPKAPEAPEEVRPETGCVQLNELHTAEVGQVEKLVADQWPGFATDRTTLATGTVSYWVYIPALTSKKDAEAKASELKKMKIGDYFIVQEDGPNNNAISLGLFSTRDAADAYLRSLRDKGVKSAKVTERNVKPAKYRLEIRGPKSKFADLLAATTEKWPEIKPEQCKSEASTAQ